MGEAKQRAKAANDAKVIEASEQERVASVLFLGGVVPENRQEQRRYDRLFVDLYLDAADEIRIAKFKATTAGEGLPLSAWSAEMEEFTTTNDVIEYFLKATDTKIVGPVSRYILRLAERMLSLKEGTYVAPSQRVVEIAADAPPTDGPTA